MKKNLLYLIILFFIYLIFKNYTLVLSSTIEATNIFLTKVFPYLFIMIFLNDLLINLGFINKFNNPFHYIFIMSILSGSPTSAFIINNLAKENFLTKNEANLSLIFTYFANPLFMYSFFNLLFSNLFITLKLMFIHYLSNYLIYLFYQKRLSNKKIPYKKTNFNFPSSLNKAMQTNIMVLGSICLFFIISSIIINYFKLNGLSKVLLKGLLEVTQGLNELLNLKTSLKVKEVLASILVSFGGLSIHSQIKCFLDEANLDYKFFLKGRIYQVLISFILTIMT